MKITYDKKIQMQSEKDNLRFGSCDDLPESQFDSDFLLQGARVPKYQGGKSKA